VNLTEAAKRLLIGRKLASYQLGETLLPKRIALPVFASDALSSVAYAPDEILLTLSLAGMSAFAFSWKIGLSMLIGILVLANLTGTKLIDPHGAAYFTEAGVRVQGDIPTVIGQLASTVFHGFPLGFYWVMLFTLIILVLAANTAFNGFPVLGSILAKDGYLPRQLYTRGDRLAYSNGIVALAAVAVALVLVYNASVTALIQLYVVGVFASFAVSQTGMMRHWTGLSQSEMDRVEEDA
jgi:amino acid transporter